MVLENEEASVLIVDDNPLITNVIEGLLGSQSYTVTTCKNGEEALNQLETHEPFDLIICDVMMPKLDGYGFHTKLRERPEYHHVPFIFLTALDHEDEIFRGKESGADDYVVKPFNPKELLATVKGKLDRSQQVKHVTKEKSEQFRKRVIHTLSHEFRTPLVAINTGTELLIEQKERLDPERAENLLSAIQRGGLRLEKLVNDFMLMQQVEAGVASRLYEDRSSKHNITELVQTVVENIREELESLGFTVTFQSYVGAMELQLYMPHVQDIVARLLDNAKKFSPERKEVEIVISRGDREVHIEVRDRGVGMDIKQVRDAIDTFGQIGRDQLEQQGGGLGLALSDRYASIHGGTLRLYNRGGGGTIAKLTLPIEKKSS